MKPFTEENLEKRIWELDSSYYIEEEPDFKQILENQKIVDIVKLWAKKEPITMFDSVKLTPKEIRIRGGSVHHLVNLIKNATDMDISS